MTVHALISLLAAAALGTALLAVGYLALRSSAGTMALLLAVWLVTIALRDSVDLSMTFSGIRISALDVLSVLLAGIGVARAFTLGIGSAGRGLALALLLLLAFHIARGVAEFGMQTAVNDARGWLYFTATLVYAATVPGGWDSRMWKIFTAVGVLLAVVAIPYLFADGLHTATQQIFRNGHWVSSRPVVAAGTLLTLQAAIIAPALGWPSKRAAVWIVAGAGAIVVLLQHRTLWVAGLVVALVGFCSWSVRRVRDAPSVVFAATGVLLLALPFAVWGFVRAGTLVTSVKEAVSNDSTLTWRTTSWTELISSHHSVSDLAFGGASGANWNRLIGGRVVDASPHDGFVDAYLRFGLPGVLVLCTLGLLLWRGREAIAAGSGLTGHAVGLLLLTQVVFSIAYTLDSIQGVIDGILVSGLAAASRAPAREAERSRPVVLLERRLADR